MISLQLTLQAPVTRAAAIAARLAEPSHFSRLPHETLLAVIRELTPWSGGQDALTFHRGADRAVGHIRTYYALLLPLLRVDRRLYTLVSTVCLPEYLIFGVHGAQTLDWVLADPVRTAAVREIMLESCIDAEVAQAVVRACAGMPRLVSFVVRGKWAGPLPLALPASVIRIGISRVRKTFATLGELVTPPRRIRHLRLPRSPILFRPPVRLLGHLTYVDFAVASGSVPTVIEAFVAANRLRRIGIVVQSLGDAVSLFTACKTRGALPRLGQLSLKCKRCHDPQQANALWPQLPNAMATLRLLIGGPGAAGATVIHSLGPIFIPSTARTVLPALTAVFSNVRPGDCSHCVVHHDVAVATVAPIVRARGVTLTVTRLP